MTMNYETTLRRIAYLSAAGAIYWMILYLI